MHSIASIGLVFLQANWLLGLHIFVTKPAFRDSLRKLAHAINRYFLVLKITNFQLNFFFYNFLIFAQNIDCGYTLEPPMVLTSTHNLCFGAKI